MSGVPDFLCLVLDGFQSLPELLYGERVVERMGFGAFVYAFYNRAKGYAPVAFVNPSTTRCEFVGVTF